jgi:hypothetical protein
MCIPGDEARGLGGHPLQQAALGLLLLFQYCRLHDGELTFSGTYELPKYNCSKGMLEKQTEEA